MFEITAGQLARAISPNAKGILRAGQDTNGCPLVRGK